MQGHERLKFHIVLLSFTGKKLRSPHKDKMIPWRLYIGNFRKPFLMAFLDESKGLKVTVF
jgi:hypothetical protein